MVSRARNRRKIYGYGNILIPCDVDENGDIIYKYNGAKQNDDNVGEERFIK